MAAAMAEYEAAEKEVFAPLEEARDEAARQLARRQGEQNALASLLAVRSAPSPSQRPPPFHSPASTAPLPQPRLHSPASTAPPPHS